MEEPTFEKQLNELLDEINNLPAARNKKLISLARRARAYNQKLRRSTETLNDSLNHLRLTIKYMMFDLEATRRENKYLRKMLEKDD